MKDVYVQEIIAAMSRKITERLNSAYRQGMFPPDAVGSKIWADVSVSEKGIVVTVEGVAGKYDWMLHRTIAHVTGLKDFEVKARIGK